MAAAAAICSKPIVAVGNGEYQLSRGKDESHRLDGQHEWFKAVLNNPSLLPPSIDLNSLTNIIDLGAGTLVWTRDFASLPQIKPRLSPVSANPVNIYACDLSSSQFPPKEVIKAAGITAFEHDVRKPFSEELRGTFDLVHLRLFVAAVDMKGWEDVLRNAYELLKPGGILLYADTNLIHYFPTVKYPNDWRADAADLEDDYTYVLCKAYERLGNYRDPVYRIPALLRQEPEKWDVVSQRSCLAPLGPTCLTMPGSDGQSLASLEDFSADCILMVQDNLSRYFMKVGVLEGKKGMITTEEERQVLMRKLYEDVKGHKGVYKIYGECVARKVR